MIQQLWIGKSAGERKGPEIPPRSSCESVSRVLWISILSSESPISELPVCILRTWLYVVLEEGKQ